MSLALLPLRRITGFHLDEAEDWVAELECGHTRHLRHNPPWQDREWVVSTNTREERIGQFLNCRNCLQAE